ncbi:hypothetical protein CVT24_008524 [Panaeolus cyanescens]|uniref:HNH nuclease domain-containing protein n=1 Tax=Panaeolus cyanescens TaxID=181874 RepID=A0A409VKW0_9AGAR|nr:hypothetical protein CVT24_008524 [Panaeolus cyanescens]
MEVNLQNVSRATKQRAKKAAVNGERCLIENCSAQRGVRLGHVLNRDLAIVEDLMYTLEWRWAMSKGTLNLDTSRNVFHIGEILYNMFRVGKWLLVPEESIVAQYLTDDRCVALKRPEFPSIEDAVFRYTFIPVYDMENVYITRQRDGIDPPSKDVLDTYFYPFDTFPQIVSHVHPRFAILHCGYMLSSTLALPKGAYDSVMARVPYMEDIMTLHTQWTNRQLPYYHKNDPTFILPSSFDDESFSDYPASDGDSVATPPRRLREVSNTRRMETLASSFDDNPAHQRPRTKPHGKAKAREDNPIRMHVEQANEQSQKRRRPGGQQDGAPPSTRQRLEQHDSELDSDYSLSDSPEWTRDKIATWIDSASSSAPATNAETGHQD